MSKQEKYCISVEEAAKRLNVSKSTIYSRLKNGNLDAKKFESKYGPKWFINQEEFEKQKKQTGVVEKLEEAIEFEKRIDPNEFLLRIKEILEEDIRNDVRQAIVEILEANNKSIKQAKSEIINRNRRNRKILMQEFTRIRANLELKDEVLAEKIEGLLADQNQQLKEENQQLQEIAKELFQQNQELIRQNQKQKEEMETFKEEIKTAVREEIATTREETIKMIKKSAVRINDYSKDRDKKVFKEIKKNRQQAEQSRSEIESTEEDVSLFNKLKGVFSD